MFKRVISYLLIKKYNRFFSFELNNNFVVVRFLIYKIFLKIKFLISILKTK